MMWDAPPQKWAQWLSHYPAALRTRSQQSNKSGLEELDAFLWTKLPQCMQKRTPGHMTAAEYARLVRWKLKRGKWRPRLQAFADALTNADVVAASGSALKALADGRVKDALAPLVALKGCGPATASAILAAADESVPFMSDELLVLTQEGDKKKYTVSAYVVLIKDVRAKAAQLTKESKGRKWTSREIERAVFAAEHYVDPTLEDTAITALESNARSKRAPRTKASPASLGPARDQKAPPTEPSVKPQSVQPEDQHAAPSPPKSKTRGKAKKRTRSQSASAAPQEQLAVEEPGKPVSGAKANISPLGNGDADSSVKVNARRRTTRSTVSSASVGDNTGSLRRSKRKRVA